MKCFSYLSVNSHSSVINIRLFGYEPKNREGGTNLNIFWDLSRFWLVQAHLSASSWSLSSSFPSFPLTLYRRSVPWKPLPWPSKRMTMVLKLLTKTVVQSTLNCSDTICPPGVPSLWEMHKSVYGKANYSINADDNVVWCSLIYSCIWNTYRQKTNKQIFKTQNVPKSTFNIVTYYDITVLQFLQLQFFKLVWATLLWFTVKFWLKLIYI